MSSSMKRKRFSLGLFLILFILFTSSSVHAWDNCPFGEVNESYPGTCGRYTDSDNDYICDLSQPAPEDRVSTYEEQVDTSQEGTSDTANEASETGSRINYFFVPILAVLCVFYTITYLLSKKNRIKKLHHRKIWNVLLLITFLISGLFGIILAIQISYGVRLSFYADLLFWHVEFGIAMAVISIFHVAWHWKYYKNMFIKKK